VELGVDCPECGKKGTLIEVDCPFIPDLVVKDCMECHTRFYPYKGKMPWRDFKCIKCDKQIPVLKDMPTNFDKGMALSLGGSYGEFFDTGPEGPIEVALCHDCAHGLGHYLNLDFDGLHSC
jgi:hypothetical protein